MEKNRVWLYCRTARKDKEAIAAQRKCLENYAAEQGFAIVGFSSDQQSGLTLDRSGLLEVSKAMENGRADIVLVMSLDRICRSVVGMVQYWNYLRDRNVRLFTVMDGDADLMLDREMLQKLGKSVKK